MTPLALHQSTTPGVHPLDLVSIARQAGCQQICILTNWVQLAITNVPAHLNFPIVKEVDKDAMLERLADDGVGVTNIELFPITADLDVRRYRLPLELGRELGAQRAVTHIHDSNETRAVDRLAELCELAAELDLLVGLEFMGLTPACNSIGRASQYISAADQANLGIAVDALHLVRTGGTVAEVAAMAPDRISYAQICDGMGLGVSTDYLPEAMNRSMPGEGDFPLVELLRALPQTVALDVEVPSSDLERRGVPPLDHARRAIQAARHVMTKAGR